MEYSGYINVLVTSAILVVYILCPSKWVNISFVFGILICFSLIKDLIYYYKCKNKSFFTVESPTPVGFNDIWGVIKESFPFYVLAIFTLFSTDWPVVFLGDHSGPVEVGYYDSANKILRPTAIILTTIMYALLPNLSKEFASNRKRFAEKVNAMFRSLVILGTFLCFTLAIFRFEIVYIVFGEEYKSTGDVLLTQCWYAVFHAVFALFGISLASMKQDKVLIILSIAYAVVSLLIFWPASYHGAMYLSYGVVLMCTINITYHYMAFHHVMPEFVGYKEASFLFFGVVATIASSLMIGESLNLSIRASLFALFIIVCFFFRKEMFHYMIFQFRQ